MGKFGDFFGGLFSGRSESDSVPVSEFSQNAPVDYTPRNQILQEPPSYSRVFASEENFMAASRADRMQAYQDLENDMAAKQGRAPRQVVFENLDPDICGQYQYNDGKIHMQKSYLDKPNNRFDGMDTVIHEGRHAYQHDCMTGLAKPDTKMQENLEGMRISNLPGVYSASTKTNEDYHSNPEEYDAHSYAAEQMNDMKSSLFSGNQDYGNFCDINNDRLNSRYNKIMQKQAPEYGNGNPSFSDICYDNVNDTAQRLGYTPDEIQNAATHNMPISDGQINAYNNQISGKVPSPQEVNVNPFANNSQYGPNCKMVPANDIDMSGAMGMDNPNFWNHHNNTKSDYMELASHLPEVQERINSGASLEDLYNDPVLGDTASAKTSTYSNLFVVAII